MRHPFVQYHQRILETDPSAYWMLDETGGIVAASQVANAATENLLSNGGFEYTHDFYTFGGWTDRVGTGAIAREGALVHGGATACKLTRGADNNTWVYQDVSVVPGSTLALSFWARGDGTVAGRYSVWDSTNSAWLIAFTSTGVTAAAYAEVTNTVNVPVTCNVVRLYFAVPTAAGDTYFDDATLTGIGTLDAAYSGLAGITLGTFGIGDGRTGVSFNGSDTSVYIGGNRFNAVWNGDKGSAIAWGRMAAAAWADVASYRYTFHIKSMNDQNYYIAFGKSNVANQLIWRRKVGAGKSSNDQTYTFVAAPSDLWFFQGYAWDISVPRLRGYLSVPGVLAFTEVFDVAGADMDAWGDHPVNDQNAICMAGQLTAQEWIGAGAHIAYWPGRVLSADEMYALAVAE